MGSSFRCFVPLHRKNGSCQPSRLDGEFTKFAAHLLDTALAWRLFTKGLDRAHEAITIDGDRELGERIRYFTAIVG